MQRVIIGVDPHQRWATIEVVDEHESVLAAGRFSSDKAGYAAMREAWPERTWAVKGSNGAGRSLAQRLVADGEHVVDVPAKLSARARLLDPGHGRKTDAEDRCRQDPRRGDALPEAEDLRGHLPAACRRHRTTSREWE